jgi:hypothetical protein
MKKTTLTLAIFLLLASRVFALQIQGYQDYKDASGNTGRISFTSGVFYYQNYGGSALPFGTGEATTGDSATGFFDAGTIEHERGGLESDVSAFDGLVKISGGSTSAVTITTYAESLLDDANEAAIKETLNLEIGTDVQAYSAALATYAGIAPSSDVQAFLACADYTAARTAIGLVIGTNVQAYDSMLADIAALSDPGVNSFLFWNDTTNSIEFVSSLTVQIRYNEMAVPSNPAANTAIIFLSSVDNHLYALFDSGSPVLIASHP